MTTAAVRARSGSGRARRALDRPQGRSRSASAWLCGAFFLAGGVLALLVRSELAVPGMQIVSHQGYDQLFTMHGSTMVYLVVQPLAARARGLPRAAPDRGARPDRARVRASSPCGSSPAAAGSCTSGFLTHDGAGSAGWTAFLPLSSDRFVPGRRGWTCGSSAWRSPTLAVIILAAVVLLTILLRRAPGMTHAQALAVLLDAGRDVPHGRVLVPGGDRGDGARVRRPPLRRARRPDLVPAALLVLRSPRRLRHVLPVRRCVAEVIPALSRKRFFGYRAVRVLADGLHGALDERVGPPPVHDGPRQPTSTSRPRRPRSPSSPASSTST